jgi:threonine aldolase
MAGGGMRQAGLLAAAALYALENHVERLALDHALARRLADGLAGIEGLQVQAPQTNIVFADLTGDARERSGALLQHLAGHGVLATGLYRLRFVTHLDVDAAGVDRAVAAIRPSSTADLTWSAHVPCRTSTTLACSSPPGCC